MILTFVQDNSVPMELMQRTRFASELRHESIVGCQNNVSIFNVRKCNALSFCSVILHHMQRPVQMSVVLINTRRTTFKKESDILLDLVQPFVDQNCG